MNYKLVHEQINEVKNKFEKEFSKNNNLVKVFAPLFVETNKGINDQLNGVEAPVTFNIKSINKDVEIVHSLAKWKRLALQKYNFGLYEGLYTNMIAIRKDEILDNTHSIYVDQWDWEKVISENDRNQEFLKNCVNNIYKCIRKTQQFINKKYNLKNNLDLPNRIKFITTQELEDIYPDMSPLERENEVSKKYKVVFIIGIGHYLKSGNKHDERSPDYDDWLLNGDLIVWCDSLNQSLELSSMGIRVDSLSLKEQLFISKNNERLEFDYHQNIIKSKLPLTIGGGIGQSRLCMFILQKKHIGEVQASIWDENQISETIKKKIL